MCFYTGCFITPPQFNSNFRNDEIFRCPKIHLVWVYKHAWKQRFYLIFRSELGDLINLYTGIIYTCIYCIIWLYILKQIQ